MDGWQDNMLASGQEGANAGPAAVPASAAGPALITSGNLTPWTTSPYSYVSRYTEYISRYTKKSFLIIVYLGIYEYERKL
jgi:hypothetical protein